MQQWAKSCVLALAMSLAVGAAPLWSAALPPPELGGPRPGVDIIVGPAGTQPANLGDVLAMSAQSLVPTGGPHTTFEATEPGYVYGQQALFIITGSDRPWRITVTGTAMNLDGGSPDQYIPPSRIEVRDAKKPTAWVSLAGGPELQNLAGEADQWMQIEFRIWVESGDAPGAYQGDVFLEWMLQPDPGDPAPTGSIPLELHLNVAEFLAVSFDFTELSLGALAGDFQGWAYSDEGTLLVRSNCGFQISVNPGPDLTGPDGHELETVLRFREPAGTGAHWTTWGDLGGDAHGQSAPWGTSPDPGSPWPGSLTGLIPTLGDNSIGVTAAAYRQGVRDLAGDYSSTITITISVP